MVSRFPGPSRSTRRWRWREPCAPASAPRRGAEICVVVAEQAISAVAGLPRSVDLAPLAAQLPGALVLHTHGRESGPSPQDLRVLSRCGARGLLLETPRAHWYCALPADVEEILEAAERGGRRLPAQRLPHLAAAMLDALGASWSRVPHGMREKER